jgi:archaellum biogenesis ATPase FlaH
MFYSAATTAYTELEDRLANIGFRMKFGIPFLDDATGGIAKHDLILIGAPSGIGKTQLCCSIALANMEAGRKVHYIALEAEPFEIERRLKYQIISKAYYSSPLDIKPKLSSPLNYESWVSGKHLKELADYEQMTADLFKRGYKDLFVLYKQGKFTIANLIENVILNANGSDLIIIDHVHYFDFDDENENRAIKDIAMTCRDLALEEGKPIILVSHLRKKDRGNNELVAGLDEFHGSSDLYKVATKVITLAPGSVTPSGAYETFMRVPKNRSNGGVSRYIGRLTFSPKNNTYAANYKVGLSACNKQTGFEELDRDLYPAWATFPERGE